MTSEDVVAKQKAFLAPYIENIDKTLNEGVPLLRYLKCSEVDECESQLKILRELLEKIPKKMQLKRALSEIEETIYYMIYLFNQSILSDSLDVDSQYEPNVNRADMAYKEKVAKALEAKQKRAPGFDGQGGGMGRRGN